MPHNTFVDHHDTQGASSMEQLNRGLERLGSHGAVVYAVKPENVVATANRLAWTRTIPVPLIVTAVGGQPESARNLARAYRLGKTAANRPDLQDRVLVNEQNTILAAPFTTPNPNPIGSIRRSSVRHRLKADIPGEVRTAAPARLNPGEELPPVKVVTTEAAEPSATITEINDAFARSGAQGMVISHEDPLHDSVENALSNWASQGKLIVRVNPQRMVPETAGLLLQIILGQVRTQAASEGTQPDLTLVKEFVNARFSEYESPQLWPEDAAVTASSASRGGPGISTAGPEHTAEIAAFCKGLSYPALAERFGVEYGGSQTTRDDLDRSVAARLMPTADTVVIMHRDEKSNLAGLGHLYLYPPDARGWKSAEVAIVVHQRMQGRGIGTQLMQGSIDQAKRLGLDELTLVTSTRSGPGAGNLPRRFGFVHDPEQSNGQTQFWRLKLNESAQPTGTASQVPRAQPQGAPSGDGRPPLDDEDLNATYFGY
ncbi:MAG TPA: GNAT family N-acetyltransferase [Albitalea sp.]|uniref:GNAT family N-acetyltransferase n=1 Tax=Piscinibacter sp. TaxID=1903157 RepID=UPI002ED3901D